MQATALVLFAVALLVAIGLPIACYRRSQFERQQDRQIALDQISEISLPSLSGVTPFEPSTVEVADEYETHTRYRSSYTLTRILRSPEGEYFLVKSTPNGPYVKHLSQTNARLALRLKYREPTPTSAGNQNHNGS